MVKKKKNRHQQEPTSRNGGDSTESCDENQANNSGGKCLHVTKAVDLMKVKKALRNVGIASKCVECVKTPSAGGGEGDVMSLWLCLKCGNQACGRSHRQHALKHHQTPHSESHALAVNTELWNIWCYDCACEVAAQCRKKLHECVEFIKRQDEGPQISKKEWNSAAEKNGNIAPVDTFTKAIKNNKMTANNLPRVRGLCNIGNTCFFNAVLQCLAQTPFLLPVLQEMSEPGTRFLLQGQCTGDLPVLEGELGKWGNLTEILASTLVELQSTKCEVFNPSRLLNKLIQRCPQFGGGEQHDSHELLRHLLESVRTEDLKRYQSAILHLFGLSEKSNPTQVEEEIRAKAKTYGRQANEMMLHPEQVFRGFLVSNLECQDCLHSSQRVESFLDLSLPVMADKPQPPVMRRKTNNDESFDVCGNMSEGQPSKHQLKKERKQARKERKRQKGWRAEGEEPTIAEENAAVKNSGESEQSDADVEDNVEQDTRRSVDVGESGYSSEKLGNEDSTVESPISQLANGDSVLASPASPAEMGECTSPLSLCDGQQSCSGDVDMSKVLVVAIPTSPLESAGSPMSNRETPSPVSSEVNIDLSTRAHGDCASPDINGDFNRPISRFAFCHDDDEADSGEGVARYSPMEDDVKNLPVSDLCEDVSRMSVDYYTNTCTSFVLVTQPTMNGGDAGTELVGGEEVKRELEEAELIPNKEEVTNEVWSNGEVANWSATVSPRYQCDDGECSIQSCLNQFTALELMTGNNKVGCENCTRRQNQGKMVCTNSTKQLLVKAPPAVLILHLKRFQVHRAMFRKMSRHVNFPLVLDLAPICSAMYKDSLMMKPGQSEVLYALYGVVEHSGTLHGGHYVAYVKVRAPVQDDDPRWLFLPPDPQVPRKRLVKEERGNAEAPPGKWYFVSDSRVSEVGEERVLRSQAYLLFYERIW